MSLDSSSEEDAVLPSPSEEESSVYSFGSEYIPTPERPERGSVSGIVLPTMVGFIELSQLDKFIEQVNSCRGCIIPSCKGNLVPVNVDSVGKGGGIIIKYACDGCASKGATLKTFSQYKEGANTISRCVQVAFIIAGCTHAVYHKTLKFALGIQAVSKSLFLKTIEDMHLIVKGLLDEMCEMARGEMRTMPQEELGSWKRAVTTVDGTWQSKNATFTIRNYMNGALLYYHHSCQKGRTDVVGQELYRGTSKSAERYSAMLMFEKAKEDGMHVAIHWQDADSPSANSFSAVFPDAEIMICAGHSGRAHRKVLESRQKLKQFPKRFIEKHREKFPATVECSSDCEDESHSDTCVRFCHCTGNHSAGCGCLTAEFIAQAHTNFTSILKDVESQEEFVTRLDSLARHARDEHEWEVGKCDFHPLLVCSCKKCDNKEQLQCEGKPYKTNVMLKCSFHSLLYEIELYERTLQAKQLVHPVLKCGHSDTVEASHNVLIRCRSKAVALEMTHYHVSTNLGLLQSNLTYMHQKCGASYHWIPELFRRMDLPVFDGVQDALERDNEARKKDLARAKTSPVKRRRIALKRERGIDSKKRTEWSKKHGHHTYDEAEDQVQKKIQKPRAAQEKKTCAARGSTRKKCPVKRKRDTSSDSSDILADDSVFPKIDGDDIRGSLEKKITSSLSFPKFEVGDYVCVHSKAIDKQHIVCRIVSECSGRYSLYCLAGVVNRSFCANELIPVEHFKHIPLNEWRQAPKVPLSDAVALGLATECTCTLPECSENVVVVSSSEDKQQKNKMWVTSPIYSLSFDARELILSPDEWLTDEIITAAQELMHQHFPNMKGFQPPPLQKVYGFDVHREEFVQIIHVKGNHWCVVSTVGCEPGIVNLYDSLYGSVDLETEYLIAGMVFSPASKLTIKMVNVERQSNSSDCGVLAIAYAFDICSGVDPCKARYDSSRTRQHLATCLSDCNFSRFPVVGSERKCRSVKLSKTVELYCTCRMPERVGEENMAECDVCKDWFHLHCQDIPNDVFATSGVILKCKVCCSSN
jgi:hypothetical protein